MTGLIVHEWISRAGGSENVLDAMMAAKPDSDVLCLWNDDPARVDDPRVRESWLASTPLRGKKALSVPLMPIVWRNIANGDRYEWILASSHLFAHQAHFARHPSTPKFVYVHTPARYIWNPELDVRGATPFARVSAPFLKVLDRRFAQDESKIAANSHFVGDRIQAAWHRESHVIYPPVDVAGIQAVKAWEDVLTAEEGALVESLPSTFILGASRFVPYKQLDTVIRVGEETDLPVVLAGSGPDLARLRALASNSRTPVLFVPAPSNALLYVLFRRALVYVFPAIEDFGIMPVEAMAAGARVVVNALGGASESVVHGVTGYHTERFRGDDIRRAVDASAGLDRAASSLRAREFGSDKFQNAMRNWMSSADAKPIAGVSQ